MRCPRPKQQPGRKPLCRLGPPSPGSPAAIRLSYRNSAEIAERAMIAMCREALGSP